MSAPTAPATLTPCSPAWYAWHAEHPHLTLFDRTVGRAVNAVIGALMATVGYGVAEEGAEGGAPAEPAEDASPRWARAGALLVILAVGIIGPLSVLTVASDPGIWPNTATAPVVAAVAAPADHGTGMAPIGPLCDTDAHCAALGAREDYAAGRVPAVAFGPAEDGGTAVWCPDGWDVDGSSVLDSHCVPTTDVIDA